MHLPVSIIIVNYNKLTYSRLCLESILQSRPLPAQIICIDNGSADGTVAYLQDRFPTRARQAGVEPVTLLNAANVGACTARNQGLGVADQPYIAFCDNDLMVRSADWLATLKARLDADAAHGIVGPKLVFPFEPYNIECAGAAISQTGKVQYRGRGQARETPQFGQPTEVQCLISACWLMRHEITDTLGGLDEVFNPAQFEDFDLCYRARQANWKVLYEPAAEMYHFENVTTDGSADVKFRYVTIRNGLEFKRRWQAMFQQEAGPPDANCQWEKLETRPFERTGMPPIL